LPYQRRLRGVCITLDNASDPVQQRFDAFLCILRRAHRVSETGALFSELLPVCRELGRSQGMTARIDPLPAGPQYRCRLLWRLMEPILLRYQEALAHESAIDFGEMLRRAIQYIRDGRYRSRFRQILVDEFQDISEPRAQLVTALPDTTVRSLCASSRKAATQRQSTSFEITPLCSLIQ
jgi:DNA helicase-4